MRTVLIFFLLATTYFSSYAQDPQLFENDWYLQKVVIDGEDLFPPNPSEEPETGTIAFIDSEGVVYITYCDSTDPSISYDTTEDNFTLQDDPLILLGFCGHPENLSFTNDYFSVFYDGQTAINSFSYTLTTENETITLTITNADGDNAVYINELLSTPQYETVIVTLYPNPVENTLHINSKHQITHVTVYDISGKMVLEQKEIFETIDVSALRANMYFLNVETNKGTVTYKIVKK